MFAVGVGPSRQGDVYSYGIFVLQMFAGRRHWRNIFKDSFNLHDFVKMAIPGRLMQIVDPALLTHVEETAPAETGNKESYISDYNMKLKEIDEENLYAWKCILPILKIRLACSEQSPRNGIGVCSQRLAPYSKCLHWCWDPSRETKKIEAEQ